MNAIETSPASHCTTCGSAIAESVNGSNFNDRECGGCEYKRYKTQAELLKALELLQDYVRMGSMKDAYAGSLTETFVTRAIAKANGKAS